MSMHFRDIAAQAISDGAIGAEEILALRQAGWADGTMDPEEAESLFIANEQIADPSPEWSDFFVEALSNFVVNTVPPSGYVDQEMADELVSRIDRDGRVETMTELELLLRVFDKAASVPASLKTYAMRQIEDAVLTGEGPTRHGELSAEGINAAETAMLRRFVFAPASDRPAAISQAEAELLFRLKDATLYETNAPEWQQLFIQGVANFLFAFGGAEPVERERMAELENFMAQEGAGIGGFLHRMMTTDPRDEFGSLLNLTPEEPEPDLDDEIEAAGEFTEQEHSWLHEQLEADENLDELEKALIVYIAEETGEVFGMKA